MDNEKRGYCVERLAWTDVSLGDVALVNGKTMRLTLGLGSGLATRKGALANSFWGIADRGPNLKVETAIERYGLTHLQPLADIDGAKIMPRP